MRIDRIEPSRRRKDRVLVFLEGGDLLRVTEQELLVFGLRPGLELPEQLLAQVEQSAKRSEMKARGARLTGSRMLSKKQVMEHLTRKGGDRELAEDTAQWLEELGAVDESAYAAAIARHYAAMGYGPGRGAAGAAAPGHPAGAVGRCAGPAAGGRGGHRALYPQQV